MALRITGAPADAADVVQETFLRAYVRIPVLRGQTIRAWLFRVAINCSHDVQRRTIRRPADPLEDERGNIVELPDPPLARRRRRSRANVSPRSATHCSHCSPISGQSSSSGTSTN